MTRRGRAPNRGEGVTAPRPRHRRAAHGITPGPPPQSADGLTPNGDSHPSCGSPRILPAEITWTGASVPDAKAASPARAATGIAGLDDILRGGFTRNRLFLIEGVPGSGKTTLALQFLL